MNNDNLEMLSREEVKEKYIGSAELYDDLIKRTEDCKALIVRVPSYIRNKGEKENGLKIFFFFNGKFNILSAKGGEDGFKISFQGENNLSAGCLDAEFLIPTSSFLYSQNEDEERMISIFKISKGK